MIEINQQEFVLLKKYLSECCGIDIPEEKSYLFKTRLHELMTNSDYKSFNSFYSDLKANKDLEKQLIEAMTTNETSFFRDTHPYDTLKNVLLPKIKTEKANNPLFPHPHLSILSAGCSTGQEPYSISMILNDWLNTQELFTADSVYVLAVDISNKVLQKAKEGIFTRSEVQRGIIDSPYMKYFKEIDGKWEIDREVKRLITFQELNLSTDFTNNMLRFDIIFCRNVIIYFSEKLKGEILEGFYKLLNPGGILMLGSSESLYRLTDKFEPVTAGKTIYYQSKKK